MTLSATLRAPRRVRSRSAPIALTISLVLLALLLGRPLIGAAFPGQPMEILLFRSSLAFLSVDFSPEAELAKGRFLVAGRDLSDPNFSQSVVLLTDYDSNGAMGLVVNQPTEVRLSRVLSEIEGLQQRTETVYIGGPVARGQMLLLIRSSNQPQESHHVFADTYVSSSRAVLQRMVKNAKAGEKFRVYAGYAGWAPGQLDHEVSRGDWHILPADTDTVFDKVASEIWPELIRRGSLQWAGLPETRVPRIDEGMQPLFLTASSFISSP